jgi:PAS domain S-box-containing protein
MRKSLARLLELDPDGVFLLEGGRIRIGNRFLTEVGGYRPEEVEGTCFDSFFHPASLAAIQTLVRTPIKSSVAPEISAALICKDGRPLPVGLRAEACRFEGRSCLLVMVEPEKRMCRNDGWDSEMEGYFVSEDGPVVPACA